MTDREHVFFISGFAQGDMEVIKLYLSHFGIDKSVFIECNEDLVEQLEHEIWQEKIKQKLEGRE
jgi:hypothetical protein